MCPNGVVVDNGHAVAEKLELAATGGEVVVPCKHCHRGSGIAAVAALCRKKKMPRPSFCQSTAVVDDYFPPTRSHCDAAWLAGRLEYPVVLVRAAEPSKVRGQSISGASIRLECPVARFRVGPSLLVADTCSKRRSS